MSGSVQGCLAHCEVVLNGTILPPYGRDILLILKRCTN